MPVTAPVPVSTLDDRLAQVSEQVQHKRAEADVLFARFDAARKRIAGEQFSDAALAAAEKVKAEYDSVADEVRALERRRDSIDGIVRGGNHVRHAGRREPGELPEPGAWLHAEVAKMAETYAIGSASGIGAATTPVQHVDAFFDLLAPKSVGLASGFSVLPTERGEVHVPRVTEDAPADWTPEGAPAPAVTAAGFPIAAVCVGR